MTLLSLFLSSNAQRGIVDVIRVPFELQPVTLLGFATTVMTKGRQKRLPEL